MIFYLAMGQKNNSIFEVENSTAYKLSTLQNISLQALEIIGIFGTEQGFDSHALPPQ